MKRKRIFLLVLLTIVIGGIAFMVVGCWSNSPYRLSTMLREAIYKNDFLEAKKILEKYKFNVNTPTSKPNKFWNGLTESSPDVPLAVACRKGNLEMVKLLIEHGATAEYIYGTNSSPLVSLFWDGHVYPDSYKIAQILLKNGADVNDLYGSLPQMPIELAAKMWPEVYSQGQTPAYTGVYDEQVAIQIKDIIALLLDNGANINGESLNLGRKYCSAPSFCTREKVSKGR